MSDQDQEPGEDEPHDPAPPPMPDRPPSQILPSPARPLRLEPEPARPTFSLDEGLGEAPKKAKRAKAREGGDWLLRIVRGAAIAALAFVVFSVGWVVVYRFLPIPGTFLQVQRLIEGVDVRRTAVPFTKISPHLARAVIAAEDSKFCRHKGFDFDAIQLAMEEAQAGERMRGASTISQQTAKNVFLWQGRGPIRKGLEAWFTLLIETLWPKHRIMEAYLNSIEFGRGYFGAEAASRGYFGKSAAKLTSRQAAALAAVLPSPNKWRVINPGPYVNRRISTVQKRAAVVRNERLDDCIYDRGKR
jgi:monofunctional biosynthetic peptidoglycan transglycosylase